MQRRSPDARFEMKRTKMPSPDTTKSVCKYSSKEFQIFFQTLFSLSSMASKVFLKTQFQEGSFRSPLAATSIVENIFYGIEDKSTENPRFFCNLVVLVGAGACKIQTNQIILDLILFHNLYKFYVLRLWPPSFPVVT